MIRIIGGGLAGSEAAWQAASMGVPVMLHEMRPVRPTAVHKTDRLAELVCSNSFRGDKLDNAVGLLKEEMRRLDSIVMRAAEENRVPAGAALAVDRHVFSNLMTAAVQAHSRITVSREEVNHVPTPESGWSPVIVATGPLTSDALSADIQRLVGDEHLSFYDAISPIVLADSIDMAKVFRASRWDRNVWTKPSPDDPSAVIGADGQPDFVPPVLTEPEGDYLNCPSRRPNTTRSTTRWPRPNRRRCTTSTRPTSSRGVCRSK